MPPLAHPPILLTIVSAILDSLSTSDLTLALCSNPLTDEVMRVDVGIEKMGHRMRIISQIEETSNSKTDGIPDSLIDSQRMKLT